MQINRSMTATPWEIRADVPNSVAGYVIFRGRGNENKTIARFPFGWAIPQPKTKEYYENESNVEAIVSAINNTYGQGINPDSIDSLKACVEYTQSWFSIGVFRHNGVTYKKGVNDHAAETLLTLIANSALQNTKL